MANAYSIPGGPIVVDNGNASFNIPGEDAIVAVSTFVNTVTYYPTSDVSNPGNWASSQGGALYQPLADPSADFIVSPANPSGALYTSGFSIPGAPTGNDGFEWEYETDGVGGAIGTYRLMSGAVEIASVTHNPLPETKTVFTHPVDPSIVATIPDFPALRIEFGAS